MLTIGGSLLLRAACSDAAACEGILDSCRQARPNGALRLSLLQLDMPLERWSLIQQRHHTIAGVARQHRQNVSWTHLSFPTESLVLAPERVRISPFDNKVADKLLHHFNADAWATYCFWLGENYKAILGKLMPDALDEYQLQARFEDYLHELRSPILADIRNSIDTAMTEQDNPGLQEDADKVMTLEKAVVSGREKLKTHLVAIWHLMQEIVEAISRIEDVHPDLHAAKMATDLLMQLMGQQLEVDRARQHTWPQCVMMLQLLDQLLDVVAVVDGSLDDARANLVYAVQCSLAELSQKHKMETLIKIAETWSDANRADHRTDIVRRLVVKYCSGVPSVRDLRGGGGAEKNMDLMSFLP